jgi:hypothetical protein
VPALDRKARVALIAAVAAFGLVAWYLTRGGGEAKTGASVAGDGSAVDPWGATGPEAPDTPSLRRGAQTPGLRSRAPGPPAHVTGVVRLAGAGTPVAGAEVAFMNETGESTVTADGSGRYAIDVASGVRWKVHARTDEAVGYPEVFEARGPTAVRDLEIARLGTVSGKVIDNQGLAVAGAEVTVEIEGGDRNLLESAVTLSTESDGQGAFELRALPGTFRVRAARGMAQGVIRVGPLEPGATLLTTVRVLWPVRIRGQVVDRESRPQAGAAIKALAALEPGIYERRSLTAGADGRFDLELPAGWVRIEATAGRGERAPVWNRSLAPGAAIDDVTLVVSAGEVLRGKVVTAEGIPVVGARVRLVAATTFDTTTGGDGHFEVSVPERIPYLVKVRHSDGYLQRQVAAWGDDEAFVMPRFGSLRIKVAGATGDARLRVDRFVPAGEAAPRAPADVSFRGSKHAIEVDNLEPGHYRLVISAPGAGEAAVEVDVPPAGSAEATVTLAAIDGRTGGLGPVAPALAGARATLGSSGAAKEARPC